MIKTPRQKMRCDGCKFSFLQTDIQKPKLECRRYPPQLVQIDHDGKHPIVEPDCFCGEYKKK
jgi:hypothetical protein